MLLSMNLHGAVDVVLNEFAWYGCCSQSICMLWMLLSMNSLCMLWRLVSMNLHAVDVALSECA